MNLLIILSPIIICFLAIFITFIGKWMTIDQLSRYLVPCYILMCDAVFVFTFVPSAKKIAIIIILAVCASAGAFMHDRKTYISGFAAAAILLWTDIIYGIVLLILCAIGLICDKSSKHETVPDSAAQEAFTPNLPEEYSAASSDESCGHSIVCISGIFEGAEFPLKSGEVITFGTDSAHCQIILNGDGIQREHCRLWFNYAFSNWYVLPLSGGITRCNGAQILPADDICILPRGTVLSFGQGQSCQQFRLE